MTPQTVLDFWFQETPSELWFEKNDDFDVRIRERFLAIWRRASASELDDWRDTLYGRLAEILVLDQFSRNLWRDLPQAFAQDNMAVALAQEAVRQKDFAAMQPFERHFMLMSLMHSESRVIHVQAEKLFRQYTSESIYDFELKHKAIIDRFGRYPHRNAVLGRESTAEKSEFLRQPDSSF